MIYLIGSLRNKKIPSIANTLRTAGFDVFDDWFAAGPEADDYWQKYETGRGHTLTEALKGAAANNVYQFDRRNLSDSHTAILAMPAGRSGHLEFGWMLGQGKKGYVLFEEPPERWDVMYQFADGVFFDIEALIKEMW